MRVSQTITKGMEQGQRPSDGLLHASSHLVTNLRHALLSFNPAIVRGLPDLVSIVRMQTGTLWHAELERWFRGQPAMLEVDLTTWMPKGWGGRADYLIWDPEMQGFRLHDLKTTKGEGINWIKRDGAKESHIWQTSLYWWACYEMGLPMVEEITVLYLPMNVAPGAELVEVSFEPISFDLIAERCDTRNKLREQYVNSGYSTEWLDDQGIIGPGSLQRRYANKTTGNMDVKLVPHWEAQFCPYPSEYCGCSTLKTTKIGHYTDEGVYVPRKGYEEILPEV